MGNGDWGRTIGFQFFFIRKSSFNFKERKKKFNYTGQSTPPATHFKSILSDVTMTQMTVLIMMRNTIILNGVLCTIEFAVFYTVNISKLNFYFFQKAENKRGIVTSNLQLIESINTLCPNLKVQMAIKTR